MKENIPVTIESNSFDEILTKDAIDPICEIVEATNGLNEPKHCDHADIVQYLDAMNDARLLFLSKCIIPTKNGHAKFRFPDFELAICSLLDVQRLVHQEDLGLQSFVLSEEDINVFVEYLRHYDRVVLKNNHRNLTLYEESRQNMIFSMIYKYSKNKQ